MSWKTGTDSELFKRYSNVKETSLKGSGRPLTERQENKARSRLKRFKLVYDTVHGLDAVDFIPYKDTKDWGTVLCSFIGYHSDKLGEIRHVSRTTFDAVSQQVNILCRLVNVQNWGKKQEETILLEFDGNYLEGALKDYHDNDIRNNIAIIYKGPAGLLSKGRFLEIVKNGCAVCNDPININFHAEIKWTTGTDEPICHKCCSDPHIMEEYGELLQKTH